MKFDYFVHRVSEHPLDVVVDHEGESVHALVRSLEVELIDPTGKHGTQTYHFTGAGIVAAKKKFVQGETVTVGIGE